MAKPNKLLELEHDYGDLHKIIPPLVNTGGQSYAAFQLQTTQSTISRWLRDNGYIPKTTYEKQEQHT
jgi:ABC-type multidrug transport system permease subunit